MSELQKWKRLEERMEALGIHEEDLLEKFVLGSGSGGQKINKTSSCVYLKHIPSATELKCQTYRSREQNRYEVRVRLCELVEERIQKAQEELKARKEKARRRNRKPSKAQKARRLAGKKLQSAKKETRRVRRDHHE